MDDFEYACAVKSVLPRNITIMHASILFFVLFVLSIIGCKENDKINFNLFKSNKKEFFKLWFKTTWSKKKCYLPAITHIMDQVTDVGVICEFYLISQEDSNINTIV